ncbi:MAG: hypothetical protein MUO59_07065 [Actinobacteria bacterium]|nr:hypothetical protein [Actinomycetota bacterium]
MSEKEFNLFSEEGLSSLFKAEKKIIQNKIQKESSKKMTNKGKEKIIEHYFNKHKFKPISIDFTKQKKEEYISKYSKYLKSRKVLGAGEMLFISYMFPFTGDPILLHHIPIGGIRGWTIKVFIKDNLIGFEKETFIRSKEDYKEEIDGVIMVIKNEIKLLNSQTIDYNDSLKDYISKLIFSYKNNHN